MEQTRSRKQPLDFRRDEVSYIMQRWKAGDSCALVGVGSVGKSNLLQHLADHEVQQAYIEAIGSNDFKAIIIDPNMLGPLPTGGETADQVRCWAGYELMMHRLFLAFYPFDILGSEDAQGFYDTYQALQDGTNPIYTYMGLRYFELGLDYFMRRGVRIVFMFDEFEDMLKNMPIRFFQNLRGLRDANKRQLSYLTFTRSPLNTVIQRMNLPELEIEPFAELFTDSVLYVGPYNDVDAKRMIESLQSRNQRRHSDGAIKFLMWATGNYAGLLRSGFQLLDNLGQIDATSSMNDETLQQMLKRRSIRLECKTIWQSLTPSERHLLKAVARIIPYNATAETEQAMAMLVQKRLLKVEPPNNNLTIKPPLFRVFVSNNPEDD